jgi:serine/threonine protein kinase
MAFPTGTKLGPYEIDAVIGAGGMGEVYRAKDTRLDRTVAIKVLPEAFARDSESKGMLDPIAGGEPKPILGWMPEDIWVNRSLDGRSVYVYQDQRTTAPVYRLDLATGKRQLVMTLAVSDPAGVTAISAVRLTPDGKPYAYSYYRELSDLFLVEGVR